jgi:hypothetical protein
VYGREAIEPVERARSAARAPHDQARLDLLARALAR